MRVAVVSRQLATDQQSGIASSSRDFIDELRRQGHVAHVLTEEQPYCEALFDRALTVHAQLSSLHAAGELDVASIPLWGCEGMVAVHDPRFPTVVTCQTGAATLDAVDPDWHDVDLLTWEPLYVGAARHLHGVSHEVLERTLAIRDEPPLTSGVVPHGRRDRAGSAHHPAPGQPIEILFVGRDEARKGLDVLREAIPTLDGDVRLTLAGADGVVSEERLLELYRRADIVCQPSRYESQGIVLVEAMMFGKPIVSTTAGGIPEVLEADGNALLAPPGDPRALAEALRVLVGDAQLRRRFGERSRQLYLERFEIGIVTRAMCDLLASAIANDLGGPSTAGMLTITVDGLRRRAEIAEVARTRVEHSRSWRLTRPLRDAARAARRG